MTHAKRSLAVAVFVLFALRMLAFTQSGVGVGIGFVIPMGHEWITRLAGVELIDRPGFQDDDPRRTWTKGLAKNTDLSSAAAQKELSRITAANQHTSENRYGSKYNAIFDAILGERWVDAGGFNIAKSKFVHAIDCWDAVAQEAVEIQYDHYMRRYDDRDAAGGIDAMQRSQQRFKAYFIAAATVPPGRMVVWDGGGFSAQYEVDRNYFLFGRAVHLFEDSFSPEHTVRVPDDNLETVRQVKAYLCSSGAEQHSHATPTAKDYSNRDVIWHEGTSDKIGWQSYRAAYMRLAPLVATEATKDLWAAFIRTMGVDDLAQRRSVAEKEADALIANWLSGDVEKMRTWYDDESHRDSTYVRASGQTGKGVTVAQCMDTINKKWGGSQMEAVHAFAEAQRICLFNVVPVEGYGDFFDTSMHMPFNWDWQSAQWKMPGAGWTIPQRAADTGTRYRFRSASSGNWVGVPDGLKDGSWLYARPNLAPLFVTQVGDSNKAYYRATFAPWLFLSYNFASPGEVKLYYGKRVGDVWVERPTKDAEFKLTPAADAFGLFNLAYKQYIWLYGDQLQLNRWGNPDEAKGRWYFEKLP